MTEEIGRLSASLPESIRPFVQKFGAGIAIDEQISIAVVIGLFAGKTVTLEQAAELTKQSVGDFTTILRSRGIV